MPRAIAFRGGSLFTNGDLQAVGFMDSAPYTNKLSFLTFASVICAMQERYSNALDSTRWFPFDHVMILINLYTEDEMR